MFDIEAKKGEAQSNIGVSPRRQTTVIRAQIALGHVSQ
jgi:hypothetical protein